MRKHVIVSALSHDQVNSGVSRISAMVGEESLWFETADTDLVLSPEAFASALLVPAMSHGLDLVFEDSLSNVWLDNSRKLIELFSQWWGWTPITITSLSKETVQRGVSHGRALCFSGGVDSFFSLLTYPEPIDKLVLVQGYDIDVNDNEGAQYAFDHLSQVAVDRGIQAVMVKTNFREHSVSGKKYKHAFGGALAAIGHMLSDTSELIISASYSYEDAVPYGSHWKSDHLYSSEAMSFVHYGAELHRNQKIQQIAKTPIFRKHMRVCQNNLKGLFHLSDKAINCGVCQKCIQTLLVLQQEGSIEDLEIFKNRTNFAQYIYQHPGTVEYYLEVYEEILRRGVDKQLELSIRALIRRSKIMRKFDWSGRRGRKLVFPFLKVFDSIEKKLVR